MHLKSHTLIELQTAQKAGQDIYDLDTGTAGGDDELIAGPGETYEDVLAEVLAFHELDELPENWSLRLIDWKIE